jgi:hypothetical protein
MKGHLLVAPITHLLKRQRIDIVAELVSLLPQLSLEKRADLLMALMPYVYPKRKALELSLQESNPGPQVLLYLPSNGRDRKKDE